MEKYGIHWLSDEDNPELLSVIKELIRAERDRSISILSVRFGVAGTIVLLDKLEKIGIIKRDKEYFLTECASPTDLLPQGLLDFVANSYLSKIIEHKKLSAVSKVDYEKTIAAVKEFLKTNLFKSYFFNEVYANIDEYHTLSSLTNIFQDLLMETYLVNKKPIKNETEFTIFLEASILIRQHFPFGKNADIQQKITDYFFMNPDMEEAQLIKVINEVLETGVDMVSIDEIVKKMSMLEINSKKTLSLIDKLEFQGKAYKPHKGYLKLTRILPKRWFE
ncbi:MAG: hypothetical protein WCW44_01945 [archaeon]|jgi:hypothetical protein